MDFYDTIAQQYDGMTRYAQRLASEKAVLQRWQERYGFHSVIDVACGTGLHAILMAEMGLQVLGADLSAAMLAKAQEHANEAGMQVTWKQAPMQELQQHVSGQFDAIFCLGNSLPHLLTESDLRASLQGFYALLNPGGHLLIQLLNYDRILARQERIVGVHRQGNQEYIRFYDFLYGPIQFNILTIDWENDKATHALHSTPLYPYRQVEVRHALAGCGFQEMEFFGDMQFEPFDILKSQNLIIVAKKAN